MGGVATRAGVAGTQVFLKHSAPRSRPATSRTFLSARFSKPGYASTTVSVDEPKFVDQGLPTTVVLQRAAPVSGRVVDQQGRPVSGAVVSATLPPTVWDLHNTVTDTDGRFTLADLPPAAMKAAADGGVTPNITAPHDWAATVVAGGVVNGTTQPPPRHLHVRHPAYHAASVALATLSNHPEIRLRLSDAEN